MRIACLGILLASAAAAQSEYTVLDVQNVPLTGDPSSAVVRISVPGRVEEVALRRAGGGRRHGRHRGGVWRWPDAGIRSA